MRNLFSKMIKEFKKYSDDKFVSEMEYLIMSQNIPVVGTTYNVSNYSFTPTGNKDIDLKTFAEKNGMSVAEAQKILENEFSTLNAVNETNGPSMSGGKDDEVQFKEASAKGQSSSSGGFDMQAMLEVAEQMNLNTTMIETLRAGADQLAEFFELALGVTQGNSTQAYQVAITSFIEENLAAQKEEEQE